MPSTTATMHEDGVSNTNTEDKLISSKTSNETVNSKNSNIHYFENGKGKWIHFFLVTGIALIFWGLGSIIYTPYELMMDVRTRMTPGLPAFDWWVDPPDMVLLKLFMFNVTNSEEFLTGVDKKMKVKEIGPIIYREKLRHTNTVFNENGTLSYTANRTLIFLPELNTVDLNSTVIMPNIPVLAITSYFAYAPFFTKMGINLMMNRLKSSPFIKTTIQNYLWNATDSLLDISQNLAPKLVPSKNVAVLHTLYKDFVDNVTVYIGPKFPHQTFFLIDQYDGSNSLPHYGSKCPLTVNNSSEGVSYQQYLTKNSTLGYWRKSFCKVGWLYFTEEIKMYGVTAYRYNLTSTTFDRTFPAEDDCHRGNPPLPNGLLDVSTCYHGSALASSFPHYLYGDDVIKSYVEGLEPDVGKHGSYVIVEPETGTPLHGVARSQLNIVMKDMKGFNAKIQRFSNISVPIMWFEYNQIGLPNYIRFLMYFTVILLPIFEKVFTVFLFILGTFFIYLYVRRATQRKHNLIQNQTLTFESERFLRK